MERAALYARVSGDLQAKEGTIESQIIALKKQIATAGDVLVKEYIDNGFSGPRFDRPALDEMRKDLKTNVFDAIYFLDADRIAREVTIQMIIIAEILKHQKQIIINGKDYVENPENKFSLTVLGAVAELERAKIMERTTRAKQLRLAQGFLLACGNNIYGYTYIRRSPTAPPAYVVNDAEAAIVREVFATYAKGGVGMNQITRSLEDRGVPTKQKRRLWRTTFLKCMLKNEMYCGIRYFNTVKRVREYANPLHGITHSSSKLLKRPKEEWIGIKVPAVISRSLFEKVQERLAWNRAHYRNPKRPQLLSSLITCGNCGRSYFAYRRWQREKRVNRRPSIHHKAAYSCNRRTLDNMHSKKSNVERCRNKEIKTTLLEGCVFGLIQDVFSDPSKLKSAMPFFTHGEAAAEARHLDLKRIDERMQQVHVARDRVIDIYASGDITREAYIARCLAYDNDNNRLKRERAELVERLPLLHQIEAVELAVAQYCSAGHLRLTKSHDFAAKRQFLLDYVDRVVFRNDRVQVHGSVPINNPQNPAEKSGARLPFRLDGRISRADMLAGRRAMARESG